MGVKGTFGSSWLGATWSLAVEAQFYLAIPFLIYFIPRKWLLFVFCSQIILAPLFRHIFPIGFCTTINMPWRTDPLFAGAILAVCMRSFLFTNFISRYIFVVYTIFGFLLVWAGLKTEQIIDFGVFNHSCITVLYTAFILLSLRITDRQFSVFLSSFPIVYLGNISYGLYLFHLPVHFLLFGLFPEKFSTVNIWQYIIIKTSAVMISLGLATASYYLLELPIVRYSHKLKYVKKV